MPLLFAFVDTAAPLLGRFAVSAVAALKAREHQVQTRQVRKERNWCDLAVRVSPSYRRTITFTRETDKREREKVPAAFLLIDFFQRGFW